jgi:hypothetical protein
VFLGQTGSKRAIEKCFYPEFDPNEGFEKFSNVHFDLNEGFDFKILTAFIRLGRAGPAGAGCPPKSQALCPPYS